MKASIWKVLMAFIWTSVPLIGIEKLADYYYFIGNPFFFTISGLRLELFIGVVFLGAILAGALIGDFGSALAAEALGLLAFLMTSYFVCDPRVCFSAGSDGLEPVRFGVFLLAVSVSAVGLGSSNFGRTRASLRVTLLTSFFASVALTYYPLVFTFAGTRLLVQSFPWPALIVLFLASLSSSLTIKATNSHWYPLLVPIASAVAAVGITTGVASSYLGDVTAYAALALLAAGLGATVGTLSKRVRFGRVDWKGSVAVWTTALALILVLSMTLVVIPDAVSGLTPGQGGKPVGFPDYAGGYMLSVPGHTAGAAVSVSFAGTNTSSIRTGNYLSAGLGLHSAGCCVDGIDYAYRFDIYLFHGGNESLVASAWEVCDDNAACGGHSWKDLIFIRESQASGVGISSDALLEMKWNGHDVDWSYGASLDRTVEFASYSAPSAENPNFNLGVIQGGLLSSAQQRASYFFQFGISSKYPVTGDWSVRFGCPSYLANSSWTCIGHAQTLQGGDSFWKVLWRWGEDYPNVAFEPLGNYSVDFRYSLGAKMESYSNIW